VFINGWDLACYDACMGQTFSVSMEFTSDPTTSSAIKDPSKTTNSSES